MQSHNFDRKPAFFLFEKVEKGRFNKMYYDFNVFSVPRASESRSASSHFSCFGSLRNLKSRRLMTRQRRPVANVLSLTANSDCLCVNVPCKLPSCYFYTPRKGLCLSGADSSHKHHNSTPCVTVSKDCPPVTFWHLTNHVYREGCNL